MSRMLRVALGLLLSCSGLGFSAMESLFFPFVSADGSLLDTREGEVKYCSFEWGIETHFLRVSMINTETSLHYVIFNVVESYIARREIKTLITSCKDWQEPIEHALIPVEVPGVSCRCRCVVSRLGSLDGETRPPTGQPALFTEVATGVGGSSC